VSALLGVRLAIGFGTPTYDFRIDTAKFQSAYGFRFEATVESIVEGLLLRLDPPLSPAETRLEAAAAGVLEGGPAHAGEPI
jgi:hypothetical protein